MTEVATGHNNNAGSGSPGDPAVATATPNVEDLQRQNQALLKEKDSLRQSVQGLTQNRDDLAQWKKTKEQEEAVLTSSGELDPYNPNAMDEFVSRKVQDGIDSYVTKQDKRNREHQQKQDAFNADRNKAIVSMHEDFPDTKDQKSVLFKKAQEILFDPNEGLTSTVDGQSVYNQPNVEYMAASRARAMLEKEAASTQQVKDGATFANASGAGNPGAGGGGDILTDKQYLELSPEGQATYDKEQFDKRNA